MELIDPLIEMKELGSTEFRELLLRRSLTTDLVEIQWANRLILSGKSYVVQMTVVFVRSLKYIV